MNYLFTDLLNIFDSDLFLTFLVLVASFFLALGS